MKCLKLFTMMGSKSLLRATFGALLPGVDWDRNVAVGVSDAAEFPGVHLDGWRSQPHRIFTFKILDLGSAGRILQIFSSCQFTIYPSPISLRNSKILSPYCGQPPAQPTSPQPKPGHECVAEPEPFQSSDLPVIENASATPPKREEVPTEAPLAPATEPTKGPGLGSLPLLGVIGAVIFGGRLLIYAAERIQ